MKLAGRLTGGSAVLLALLLIPSAMAANEQLKRATALFNEQSYVAAQETLLNIDRSSLDARDGAAYDSLLKVLPQAIRGGKQAAQNLGDADTAYAERRWNDADGLYARVISNEFATPAARDLASAQRQRIAQMAELSEAAKPTGPVAVDSAYSSPPARPTPTPSQGDQPRLVQDESGTVVVETITIQSGTTQSTPAQSQTQQPVAPQPTAPAQQPAAVETVATAQPAMAPSSMPPAPPRRRTLIDDLRSRDSLLWQRAVAKMNEAAKQAGEAVAVDRFDDARRLAESALQVIEANRAYAEPASRYEAARAVALDLQKSVKQAQAEYDLAHAAEQRDEIAHQIENRRRSQDKQRQEKIEQLFNTARQLEEERRFSEAAEAMQTVLALDPSSADADFWLDQYLDLASLQAQKRVDRDIDRQTRLTLQQADESRIPWGHDILYPKNWMELVTRRAGIEDTVGPGEDFELNRILDTTQAEISFEERPFDQVVDFLTELNELNIAVDWEDLERAGIDRDKPVSLRLKNISLRTVLTEILSQVGGDTPVTFAIGEGLLRVATKEKLDRDKYTLVYDIRDLIVNIPRFADAPLLNAGNAGEGDWKVGGPGSDRNSLFGSDATRSGSHARAANPSQRIVSEIMDVMRQTIEPDSWRESGGGDGALRELNGQLIVYNTSEAHQQTRALLDQLRDARALMINVESRFLVVSSNFLEEIGVDLDFVFNSGSAAFDPAFNSQGQAIIDPFTGAQAMIPRQNSLAGVIPAIPPFGSAMPSTTPVQPYGHAGFVPTGTGVSPHLNNMTPIIAQQSSLSLADPRFMNTGIPGSLATQALAPALNIAGSFLDNLQVDFLIRATQANRRSSIVQAPRLMMFNGQRAYVAITRSRQYVSSVTPSVAEGAVGVQPVQAAALSGTTLDVEGTISADRKYVTITIRTDRAGEPAFQQFEVQRASGNSPGIFIMLPDQEQTSIRTTVSVPDGGTVLLGGLKQVGEVEIEVGVPILSKIPILKRAFTNTTEVKDTQTLLILLKAKILIQKEAEDEAFPTLTSIRS